MKIFSLNRLISLIMVASTMASDGKLITHTGPDHFDMEAHITRLKGISDPILPIDEEISISRQLTEFDLGRYLLINRGINGYWTSYWLIHGPQKNLTHPLENWLINRAPSFRASRERLKIFQDIIQRSLHSNMRLASIPCGLMDDLLGLDYTNLENVELDGYDLDEENHDLALSNKDKYATNSKVTFHCRDAWQLGIRDQYDLITSNGLNFYEPDDRRVVELYRQFYQALRVNGILVTSFLTPPPSKGAESPWKDYDKGDALKQLAIFRDIMNAKWSATRTEELTRRQLEAAGFKEMQFIYDSSNIFPTVIARKK